MICRKCHKKEAMFEYSICRDCFGKKINPKEEKENGYKNTDKKKHTI